MIARPTPYHARRPAGRRSVTALLAGLAGAIALALLPTSALAAGAWRDTAPLGTDRADHTATRLKDGRILVAGGVSGFAPTASAEIYDPRSQSWIATGTMGTARSRHTAVLLDGPPCQGVTPPVWCGQVLVAGGTSAIAPLPVPLATAELYDPATGTWAPTGALAVARFSHTATLLQDGRVLAAGGAGGGATLASTELYEPGAGSWTTTGDLTTARSNHTATLLHDGRVLAAGGANPNPIEPGDLYVPGTGQWSATTNDARSGRFNQAASLLPSGDVLVTGGFDGDSPRRLVDLFDPVTEWASPASATAPPMATPRSAHTSTLMPSGHVLVAGGGAPNTAPVFGAELFDPVADVWTSTGSLQTPRSRHTATLLSPPGCEALCGQVLVAGGTGGAQPMAAAELYDPVAHPVPGRVEDLAATATSDGRAVLTFGAPSSDGRAPPPAGRYRIAQSTQPILEEAAFDGASILCGGVCVFSPTAIGDRLTLTVTGLTPGTEYHYAVRAEGADGTLGALSNPASVVIPGTGDAPAAPGTGRSAAMAPGRVGALTARAISAHRVRLAFTAPADAGEGSAAATRYVVKRSRRPLNTARAFDGARALCAGTCRISPRPAGARAQIVVTEVAPSHTYHFAVRARSGAGLLGAVSRSVRARTPPDRIAPGRVTGVRGRAASASTVRLTFRAPASDGRSGPPVGRFEVHQARAPITSARRFRRAKRLCRRLCRFAPRRVGDRLTLVVSDLCPRTTYHFAIRAHDTSANAGPRARFAAVRTRSAPARRGC